MELSSTEIILALIVVVLLIKDAIKDIQAGRAVRVGLIREIADSLRPLVEMTPTKIDDVLLEGVESRLDNMQPTTPAEPLGDAGGELSV